MIGIQLQSKLENLAKNTHTHKREKMTEPPQKILKLTEEKPLMQFPQGRRRTKSESDKIGTGFIEVTPTTFVANMFPKLHPRFITLRELILRI